ncbi:MAG: MiaB/RimO family radical SAM methylthiotransferase, partial [Coriobacteriia bacterium]|nr:MiaB/RimO family radical SAM methylthiotransferase [Coriobacteriia bacterium]
GGTGLVFQFDQGQIGTLTPSPCSTPAPRSTPSPVPPVPIPWAYVKISDGCSRHCSYCTIPSIRGPYHSYSFEAIINEVESLVAQGAREIILVGQDTGIWSAPEKPQNLAELLNSLASAYPQTWFRVMYLQPEGITDELLAVMAQHANIARYLDIPLQHASAEILASMNRKGSGKEYLELVSRIREALPGVVLRTTVMVGYPGESPEDYNELCAFIEAACFDYVGIFVYSPEEGTAAAALSRQIDEETAKERLQELRDKADLIGFERADRQLGQRTEVLICGQDEEGVYGRTKGQAPDVDGITYLYVPNDAGALTLLPDKTPPGTVVQVTISETVLYDLFAEITTETQ